MHSVIQFYSLSALVSFKHLADFCCQCGKVMHIKKDGVTTSVELAVDAAVAASIVGRKAEKIASFTILNA